MRTKKFTKVVNFLGVKLKCNFIPDPIGYRSELSPEDVQRCYRAALRYLCFDCLQEGTRIEISSAFYKFHEPEYKVKLFQYFAPPAGEASDYYTIYVTSNEFPNNETYIIISESYLLCK
jgi:hypothetical protein